MLTNTCPTAKASLRGLAAACVNVEIDVKDGRYVGNNYVNRECHSACRALDRLFAHRDLPKPLITGSVHGQHGALISFAVGDNDVVPRKLTILWGELKLECPVPRLPERRRATRTLRWRGGQGWSKANRCGMCGVWDLCTRPRGCQCTRRIFMASANGNGHGGGEAEETHLRTICCAS